tara:strand:- start:71 stop:739 length:669 start_codon:yes stop_codon:yes gene_type:complete
VGESFRVLSHFFPKVTLVELYMATVTTPTSELEAVNSMLSATGRAPVNSLTGGSTDVAIAKNILDEISREVQTRGWHFNTDKEYTLTLDGDSKLPLPANTLRVDSVSDDINEDVVQRGSYLYHRKDHTFVFTANIKVDLVVLLTFTDLPEAARRYITVRAARIFQESRVGSDTKSAFNRSDEATALALLKKAEGKTGNHNILYGNNDTYRIIDRRSRYSSWL